MYAKDLIGQWAIRTAPACNGDRSFMTTPVKIASVLCSRIELDRERLHGWELAGHILPASFDDNKWQPAHDDSLIKIQIGSCKCFNVSRQVASAVCKLLEAI